MERALRMTAASEHTSWHTEMTADLLHLWLAQLAGETLDLGKWLPPEDTATPPNREQRKMLCDRALRFMRANCTRRIGLRDIAQHVGISARHLGRLFHDVLGDSVNSTLMRLRLEQAHAMLSSDSSLLVKQVALATGFNSPAYFTHCFRRAFGCLPREVRREGTATLR